MKWGWAPVLLLANWLPLGKPSGVSNPCVRESSGAAHSVLWAWCFCLASPGRLRGGSGGLCSGEVSWPCALGHVSDPKFHMVLFFLNMAALPPQPGRPCLIFWASAGVWHLLLNPPSTPTPNPHIFNENLKFRTQERNFKLRISPETIGLRRCWVRPAARSGVRLGWKVGVW